MTVMSGTDVGNALLPLTGVEREKKILNIFQAQGLAPNAGGSSGFRRISTSMKIDKKVRVLEMDVSALPAGLGTEEDPFLLAAWPWTYQTIADSLDCLIPTKKICTLVAQQANFRVPPITIAPNNESSALYVRSNQLLQKALTNPAYKSGMLVVSPKKDVVVGPGLDGKLVAIFGWFYQPGPQTDTKEGRIQPYSTVHSSQYVDYSHGWRLVRRIGFLDGAPVSLPDVARDTKLSALLSDQGPLSLHFPSMETVGPGAVAKVATGASIVGGAAAGAVVGALVGGPVGAAVGGLIGAAFGRNA